MKKKAFFIAVFSLLLSGCGTTANVIEDVPEPPFIEEQQRKFTPLFNPLDVSLNDKVGVMTVTSIHIEDVEGYGTTGVMTFQGKVSLNGTYKMYKQNDLYGQAIVFYPDEESSSKLPKFSHDNRPVHILITNQDLMKKMIQSNSSSNKLSIVINEYTIHHDRDQTVNEATVIPPDIE